MNPLLGSNSHPSLKDRLKGIADPMAVIRKDPRINSLLSLYKGDAKSAFYALCKERGIDPESILSQLR